jgi:hypothetical protein
MSNKENFCIVSYPSLPPTIYFTPKELIMAISTAATPLPFYAQLLSFPSLSFCAKPIVLIFT